MKCILFSLSCLISVTSFAGKILDSNSSEFQSRIRNVNCHDKTQTVHVKFVGETAQGLVIDITVHNSLNAFFRFTERGLVNSVRVTNEDFTIINMKSLLAGNIIDLYMDHGYKQGSITIRNRFPGEYGAELICE